MRSDRDPHHASSQEDTDSQKKSRQIDSEGASCSCKEIVDKAHYIHKTSNDRHQIWCQ